MSKCGAKTRNGSSCKKPPINGSSRCKNHGGKTPRTPGSLYSQYLSADDLKNFDLAASAIGKLDTELQLVRMQLARVMRIRSERDTLKDHMQLDEHTDADGRETAKKKLINYDDLIIRYTGRIENLETKRLNLINQELDAEIKRKQLVEDEEGDMPESKKLIFTEVDGRKPE